MSDLLSDWHAKWANGDQKAYYEVFWIMQHYLGIDWIDLQKKHLGEYVKASELILAIEDYHKGKPIAYIVGNVEFYRLNLLIKEGVLIPRADTEPMVSEIIERLQGNEKILELGTGSGAIACAIASHREGINIDAIDKSSIACEIAKQNVDKLGLEKWVKVEEASWYDLDVSGYDWVIANPPYIAEGDLHMSESVKQYEPSEALIAGEDGYQDLFYIIRTAKQWLVPGGYIALEHGFMQQALIEKYLKDLGYTDILLGSDKANPRFVIAKL